MEDVYLCVNNNMYGGKYKCHRFNSFIEADSKYRELRIKNQKNFVSSTMIPVFKYIPEFIKTRYLQYKLAKVFCRTEIVSNE